MKTILSLALLIVSAALAQAAGEINLNGTYHRGKEADSKPLTAVLTPDGKDAWKVVWQAQWKKMEKYTGTITGNLKNGTFTGTGTKDGKRTFLIEGKAKDGKLTFDHFETTGGKKGRTGGGTLQ